MSNELRQKRRRHSVHNEGKYASEQKGASVFVSLDNAYLFMRAVYTMAALLILGM